MIGRRGGPPSKEPVEEKPRGFDDFELRLGDVLRGERATLGKSLLDVQRELKIKANYIAAIENADPSAFESPGFIAGYVRSYARYLQLDPEWAFETFCREAEFQTLAAQTSQPTSPLSGALGAALGSTPAIKKAATVAMPAGRKDPFADPSVSFVPKGESVLANVEPRAIGSTLVLLALIAGLGYGGWTVLQQVQRVTVTPVEQAPGVFAEVDPLATPGSGGPEAPSFAGVDAATPDALDRLYRPQALETPRMVPRDGPIASIDPNATGALAPDPEAARAAAVDPRATAPGSGNIVVMAVRPAWVQVRNAEDTVVFEETLGASGTYIVPEGTPAPILRAGAAGGIYFAVDGKLYGPAGPSGTVADGLVLDRASLLDRFRLADLSLDPALEEVLDRQKANGALLAEAQQSNLPLPQVLADAPDVVSIVAVREAWVRVRAEDGTVLFSETMQPGQSYALPVDVGKADLRAGAAGSVYLTIAGTAYGPVGARGEVKNVADLSREAIKATFDVVDLNAAPALRESLVAESQ